MWGRLSWGLGVALWLVPSGCVLSAKATPCEGEACIIEGDEVDCDIPEELPEELLGTCFAEIAEGRLAPNLRGFQPQFELASGDVDKRRWIYVPPGSSIDATNPDQWSFPTGTIIWREVAKNEQLGDRIETQMLEKNGLGLGRSAWRASVYLWTADQSNAHRVKSESESYVVDDLADWNQQDESTCMDCHQAPDDVVLGFSTLQLSDVGRQGSIDTWSDYLTSTSTTTEPSTPVQIPGSATDIAMLGYMHANCGTCHSPRGIVAGLGLELNHSVTATDLASSRAMATGLYKDLRIVPTNVAGSSVYALVESGAMPPTRRTSAIDVSFRTDLGSWIAALERSTAISVDSPLSMEADQPEGQTLLGYDRTKTDTEQGAVFERTEPYSFRSRAVAPVDPTLTYRVSGRFRSAGTTPSRFYYGLAPYDADGEFISPYRANRRGTLSPIVRASTTTTAIITTLPIDDWSQPTTVGYQRAVGIYFDGDTTHLPDYVLTKPDNHIEAGPDAGAYSSAVGTQLSLNVELPADVLAQMTDQTIVANHYSGSTYLYTAASSLDATAEWTEYAGELSGAAFSASAVQFRPETAFVKIIILANYQQAGEATELLWDDLRLEVVEPTPTP